MKKILMNSAIISLSLMSFLSSSHAADTAQTTAIACNSDAYQAALNQILMKGRHENLAWEIPVVTGAGMLALGLYDGVPQVAVAGVAVAGAGGLIYLSEGEIHKIKGHFSGDQEVINNLTEATNPNTDTNADLEHTLKLIHRMDKKTVYSLDQLKRAVILASESGELCRDNKLLVKNDFRRAVINQLRKMNPIEEPAPLAAADANPSAQTQEKPATPVGGSPEQQPSQNESVTHSSGV
jgi:hypothetical protein